MANGFYISGEQRAPKVNELFDTIAPRYDFINDVQSLGLHRWWKRRLINLAQVRPDEPALDVCCGTGDLAFALARRGAAATGLDFSEQMLAVARAKSERSTSLPAGGSQPTFVQGDAMRLPFPDLSFAIVTVGYGLRNLSSWEQGLEEMRRVARPGGRLLALDFGKPDHTLWRALYFSYLRTFVPLLGRIFCGNASAYAYILESLHHYPAQRGVEAKMRSMGLENVRTINLLGGIMSINYGETPD